MSAKKFSLDLGSDKEVEFSVCLFLAEDCYDLSLFYLANIKTCYVPGILLGTAQVKDEPDIHSQAFMDLRDFSIVIFIWRHLEI